MKLKINFIRSVALVIAYIGVGMLFVGPIYSNGHDHSNPIAKDFEVALQKSDVTPLLKYANKNDQESLRKAFNKILVEGRKDPQRKEQLNNIFFDMVSRMGREKKDAPYDAGLMTSAGMPRPTAALVNNALGTASVESLLQLTKNASSVSGIRERFKLLLEKKKHRNESLEASDEFRKAFIALVNYIEEKCPGISK